MAQHSRDFCDFHTATFREMNCEKIKKKKNLRELFKKLPDKEISETRQSKNKKKTHQNRNFFFDHSSHNSPLLMSATPQFKPHVCNASQILYRVILNENP